MNNIGQIKISPEKVRNGALAKKGIGGSLPSANFRSDRYVYPA
jgi:hypothetical protein